jgi:FG-GAP repeat protein
VAKVTDLRRVRLLMIVVAIALGSGSLALAQPSAFGATKSGSKAAPQSVLTDFNADGFADLAIGVPFEDVGTVTDAGAVHVLYGSPSGLQATAPNDQFWSQDSPNVGDSAEPFDKFGSFVAAGEFNADGFADLAIGVPFEDVGAVSDAGAVQVLYGSAAGLQATAPDDQLWSQDSPSVLDTAEPGDRFGSSLTAGGFNGDGYADLVVGVSLENVGAVSDAGAVQVLYGSAAGLQATAPDDQLWSQDSPEVLDTAEQGDQFGFSVAAGNFNNDAFDDVAVGAPTEDVRQQLASVRDAGSVSVLYGSAAGLQATAPDDQVWSQGAGGVQDRPEVGDSLGWSATTGDFNGDGFDDLVAGAPLEDVGSESRGVDGGAANVLYGSAAGLQASAPDDQFWNQDVDGVIGLAEHLDAFGYSVAAGDFEGDGFDDLAVGVPREDGGGESIPQSGAANILYGSAEGIQAARDWHLEQGDSSVTDSTERFDRFAAALAIDDFNGDGHADLAAGVPFEEVGVVPDAGAVHVLYSTEIGLQAENPDDRLWTQGAGGVLDKGENSDRFGWALAGPMSSSSQFDF